LKQAVVVLVVVLAAAQLVRPDRANPPTDPSRTIQAHVGTTSGLAAVLDRSCNECHSNAPVSWLMAYTVDKGRKAVNFSDWAAYEPDVQRTLLAASCEDASNGRMPGAYTLIRPDARLSTQDIQTICAVARQARAGPLLDDRNERRR
jgi:formate-dependent nitrite reductase cytochrome c552 subunit